MIKKLPKRGLSSMHPGELLLKQGVKRVIL